MPRSPSVTERRAYTVSQFCEAYSISKAQYYELRKTGKIPAEAHVGGRVIISVEAAERWLQERQAETKENPRKHLRRKEPVPGKPRKRKEPAPRRKK